MEADRTEAARRTADRHLRTGEIGRRIAETLRLFGVSPIGISQSGKASAPFSGPFIGPEEAEERWRWRIG
ncbi:hypothetical protein F6Y04_00950 [Bacillus megaterium]|nr:hypothetical protein [Priestia megaterium]